MLEWLTFKFKKSCFLNCSWLRVKQRNYEALLSEYRDLEDCSHVKECVKRLNLLYEHPVSISIHKDRPILITLINEMNHHGRLEGMTFHCYSCDSTSLPNTVQTLHASIEYDYRTEVMDHVYICDFIGHINAGYGSIVMEVFLNYILSLGIKR